MHDEIPTARGNREWYAATVKAVVESDNCGRARVLSASRAFASTLMRSSQMAFSGESMRANLKVRRKIGLPNRLTAWRDALARLEVVVGDRHRWSPGGGAHRIV